MSEAEAITDSEPCQAPPPPGDAQRQMLQAIINAGNTAFLDADERVLSGTPSKPGPPVGTALEVWLMVPFGLIAGERNIVMTTRVGRRFAATGDLVEDQNITISDVDLAAWGKGDIDYLQAELLEGIDASLAEIVLDRQQALDIILNRKLITAAEARQDVRTPTTH